MSDEATVTDEATANESLVKQLESDGGPHATTDAERAAAKRRAAAGLAQRDAPGVSDGKPFRTASADDDS